MAVTAKVAPLPSGPLIVIEVALTAVIWPRL